VSETPKSRGTELVAALLAGGVSLLRLVPHPWNLTPLGAAGLFAGAQLRLGQALALALGLRVITDIVLQAGGDPDAQTYAFFFSKTMAVTYACLAVNVLLGRRLCRPGSRPWRVGAAALLGSVQFFLITNFVSWLGDPRYPATLGGLLQDYAESLPFFRGTIAGDLLYSVALFGSFAYLARHVSAEAPETVPVGEKR
jgi:hypothetical protein